MHFESCSKRWNLRVTSYLSKKLEILGRSQQSFGKRERELKREKKRKEKEAKKLVRSENKSSLDDDSMIAYVDAYGNVTDTPPDPEEREEINAEDIELGIPKKETLPDDAPRIGIVSFFNDSKGFGFIRDLESRESIFVHINNVEGEIKEDSKVSFEVEQGPRGLAAVKVELYKEPKPE